MTFWTAGAAWMAHFFHDYYLYTGDRKFFVERALPFMKETAAFYEDFLVEDAKGRYQFNPSYSPENNPGNSKSQATINATMDIAAAKELFTSLVDVCQDLGLEPEGVQRWKRMLAKMPDYMVNSDGALKEWTWPGLEDNYPHRHLSHLYPLYHGMRPDIAARPDLIEACRRAIELRMKERIPRSGGNMAFGLVLLGQSATSLRDGKTADQILRWLTNHYFYAGLAASHDPGPKTFNVDISGGLPDLVIRMLVQSAPGRIDLLPAWPSDLPSGNIEGVLARGQVLVKSLGWAPGQIDVVLHSPKDQTVVLSLPKDIVSLKTAAAKATKAGRLITLALPGRQDVALSVRY
jgi:hypothetical protein